MSHSIIESRSSETADLASVLVDKILFTQRSHLHRTGQKLSYDEALAKLAEQDDAPPPANHIDDEALEPVRAVLATLPYTERCNAMILETIRKAGSVWVGLDFLTPADRTLIEAALPWSPDYNHPAYDDFAGSRGRAGLAVRARAKDGVWSH